MMVDNTTGLYVASSIKIFRSDQLSITTPIRIFKLQALAMIGSIATNEVERLFGLDEVNVEWSPGY